MSVTHRITCALTLAATLLSVPAHAATFVVDDTGDAGDVNPGDGACETLVPGQCTLRAAIQEANALNGTDRIELPEGVFPGGHVLAGRLEIVGAGRDATFIDGGGVSQIFSGSDRGSDLLLERLTLANGFSSVGAGGLQLFADRLTLQDVHVTECRGEVGGLGVRVTDLVASELLVTSCTGTAGPGGLDARANQGSLSDSTFRGNTGRGGGASLDGCVVERCTFEENTSVGSGGGLYLYGDFVRVVDSVFRGNHAKLGGGVAAMANGHVTFGQVTLLNCTVSGNTAELSGAGVYHEYVEATMTHCTITENSIVGSQGEGGGIGVRDGRGFANVLRLGHCILAGNDAPLGSDCLGLLRAIGPNLVLDDAGCDLELHGHEVMVGIAPRLGPLADNGGATLTHALLHDSPAIDAGVPGDCFEEDGTRIAEDQTGFPRPSGLACDLGAYEFDVTNDMDEDGVPDVTDNCAEVVNDQLDSDGDGWGDECDCAASDAGAFAVPGEVTLLVRRTRGVELAWTDESGGAGDGVRYDIASDTIASLRERGVADAGCSWTGTQWLEVDVSTGGSAYYLVRALNSCGPGPGGGWGRDSFDEERPACP